MEKHIPKCSFRIRKQTDISPGFEWRELTTDEIFFDKKVVIFAVPGAFTPTCSSTHLPGFEANYNDITRCGIDEVYCVSVNDTFVMNSWFRSIGVNNVKAIPDGSGDFTRKMGMLVRKDNLSFGFRSWRYSMVVNNTKIEKMFIEDGIDDNATNDPFEVSDVYTMLNYLREN